ncbi:hypothetical protein ACJX0J_016605, partial [Zea mays]
MSDILVFNGIVFCLCYSTPHVLRRWFKEEEQHAFVENCVVLHRFYMFLLREFYAFLEFVFVCLNYLFLFRRRFFVHIFSEWLLLLDWMIPQVSKEDSNLHLHGPSPCDRFEIELFKCVKNECTIIFMV